MRKALVYQIAKRCREISEKFVGSLDAQPFDFFNPNDNRDLFCFCACGSIFLTQKLKENGIDAVTVVGDMVDDLDHCWTEVDGKYIVDITATQFLFAKDKPVLIGKYKQFKTKYKKKLVGQLPYNWPINQKPNKKVIEKLNNLYEGVDR